MERRLDILFKSGLKMAPKERDKSNHTKKKIK